MIILHIFPLKHKIWVLIKAGHGTSVLVISMQMLCFNGKLTIILSLKMYLIRCHQICTLAVLLMDGTYCRMEKVLSFWETESNMTNTCILADLTHI